MCCVCVVCEQACIGAFAFYLLGFGFAYHNGNDGDMNSFIGAGKSNFALSGRGYDDTDPHGSTPRPRPEPEPEPEPEAEP